MTIRDRDQQLCRMIDRVLAHRRKTSVENWGLLLLVLSVDGGMLLAARPLLADGTSGLMFAVLFISVNLALFAFGYVFRKRRKTALLNIVLPRDRSGVRRLDQQAYMLLTAEHRAIEEAEFRKKLAKAIESIR